MQVRVLSWAMMPQSQWVAAFFFAATRTRSYLGIGMQGNMPNGVILDPRFAGWLFSNDHVLSKTIAITCAIAVFAMNAVCFCVLSQVMAGPVHASGQLHRATLPCCCKRLGNEPAAPASSAPSPGKCDDHGCHHCPGTLPMLAGKVVGNTVALNALHVAPLPQCLGLPILMQAAGWNAQAHSVCSATDPPTLLNLGCSLLA